MGLLSNHDPEQPCEPRGVVRHFAVWCVVCWVAAAPSFFWGAMIGNMEVIELVAMVMGVFVFIVMYTAVSTSAWFKALRGKHFVERTLKIGYGIRIVHSLVSIIPPIMIVDMIFGMISLSIAGGIFGHDVVVGPDGGFAANPVQRFATFLTATLIQGALLNIVLLVLMLVIYGMQRAFCKPPADPTKFCAGCGYDLRASRESCPECGMVIPARVVEPYRVSAAERA